MQYNKLGVESSGNHNIIFPNKSHPFYLCYIVVLFVVLKKKYKYLCSLSGSGSLNLKLSFFLSSWASLSWYEQCIIYVRFEFKPRLPQKKNHLHHHTNPIDFNRLHFLERILTPVCIIIYLFIYLFPPCRILF